MANTYLTRTPSSNGNQKKFTINMPSKKHEILENL